MTQKDTSGPAFPQPQGYPQLPDNTPGFDGLSMRDYFAAMAMQGLIVSADFPASPEVFANAAYLTADAMLKEREK